MEVPLPRRDADHVARLEQVTGLAAAPHPAARGSPPPPRPPPLRRPLPAYKTSPPVFCCDGAPPPAAKCTIPTLVPSSAASVPRSDTSPVNLPVSPCS